MATDKKDLIYVDIDDEITGVIDKLRNSSSGVVALVLPKRATAFQSVVNMKLLKRAADAEKKNLVLVTSEAGLMPLAGAAGVHVAKTPNSKPEIPLNPEDEAGESVDDSDAEEINSEAPVGELADTAAVSGLDDDAMETVELDSSAIDDKDATKPKKKSFAPPKDKKDSKLKVPNFNKFRLFLIIGIVALILLIVFGFMAVKVWPRAIITLSTNATAIDYNLDLKLSTEATDVNESEQILPAKRVEQQKTYTQEVATTGQKNNGNKASGTVTITNCSTGDTTLPAGSGLTSGGNTYITQQSVTIPVSDFKGLNGPCKNNGTANVNVIAQSPGTASNGANSFAIPSHSGLSGSASSTISGGTDNIVRVVNQNDINNAQSKISSSDSGVKSDLENQLRDAGFYPISATYNTGNPSVNTSAKVGQVADNVSVTQTVSYSMFGAKQKDLKTLVNNEISNNVDSEEQGVIDDGISKARFTMASSSSTVAQVTMQSKAMVGPKLDVAQIRRDSLGKKSPEIKSMFNDNPDVTNVDVKLSPFWVGSVPNDSKKVTVKVTISKAQKSDSSDD